MSLLITQTMTEAVVKQRMHITCMHDPDPFPDYTWRMPRQVLEIERFLQHS